MQYLSEINKPTWLRYVLVPDYTDDSERFRKLGEICFSVQKCRTGRYFAISPNGELYKWKEIGRAYPLEKCRPADMEDVKKAVEIFRKYHLPLPDNQK
ncbi:MAG: hypothetical protein U0T85_00745 [Cloacibacterium normanense]